MYTIYIINILHKIHATLGGETVTIQPAHSGSTTNVHPFLSSMVNYIHPMKFTGFDEAEKADCHYKMSSFAEPAALG